MQRYFLEKETKFYKDDIHHILNVMRFKQGDRVEVCYDGICYLVELNINQKDVSFNVVETLKTNKQLDVTLVQGLPKGDKIDFVVKSATIFGAKEIVFLPMKRSIAKLSNIEHKLERLRKIAKEAAELAKLSFIPQIKFLNSINDLSLDYTHKFLLDEEETSLQLESIEFNLQNRVIYIIGPEGGIDIDERNILRNKGFLTLSLGQTILPTELAHIPLLNYMKYRKNLWHIFKNDL